tara:strand:- start:436 stop:657 length:222 start_codon:yes stop_codon:yes gene_type:complete
MSESENTDQTKTVTVNTNYARFAILLLAANFMLTGYAIVSLINIQEVTSSITPTEVRTVTVANSTEEGEKLAQ